MGDNDAGDDVDNSKIDLGKTEVNLNEEIKPEVEKSIFDHFHKKYLLLTSVDGKEKTDSHDTTKTLLESMISELNCEIKKINEDHEFYLRCLGMKIFLHHLLAKFVNDSDAITLLENIYKEAKPHFSNPQVAYSGFLLMNSFSTLVQKSNSLEQIKDLLEECQNVYNTLKVTNKEENYFSGKELFSPDIKMESNKEARMKYEKIVITNLLFLGSIYEKLGNHYKDIVCYHTAFSRMLNMGLVSPFKWVDFTTRLACVFIDDNNFKDARHHLSAATHVNEILEQKNKATDDITIKDLLKNNAIHLALAWVRYCVLLFEKSKDEDRTKFIIFYKNGYFFPNSKCSKVEKAHFNEYFENHILNDRNLVFQNQRFFDTIDKEMVEDEQEKFDEYNDIIREKNTVFADGFHDIGEDKKMSSTDKNAVDEKHDANDPEEGTSSIAATNLKDNESKSMRINSDDSLNKQSLEDESKLVSDNGSSTDSVGSTHKSKPEEENNQERNDAKEINLVFSSLGYLPIEHTVTKNLIQNPEEARQLFTFGLGWSKQAQTCYPSNTDFYSHVHVVLNMVSLYRLCAYFQGRDNLEYRISLEQTRENMLEQLVAELSEIQPESHLHVRLYQEMALLNIDLAMLNMCNIYNICADDTYKLCALAEIQSHINHTYIVGDMLEKSTEIIDKQKSDKDVPRSNTSK